MWAQSFINHSLFFLECKVVECWKKTVCAQLCFSLLCVYVLSQGELAATGEKLLTYKQAALFLINILIHACKRRVKPNILHPADSGYNTTGRVIFSISFSFQKQLRVLHCSGFCYWALQQRKRGLKVYLKLSTLLISY